MPSLLIIWGNWGPYHYARYKGLCAAAAGTGWTPYGWQIFGKSAHYAWTAEVEDLPGFSSFDPGMEEPAFPAKALLAHILPTLRRLRPDVVLVPSYWHWSLLINYTAKLLGARVVMMNESHGGTESATGWKKWVKHRIVSGFHAGLVGGQPHIRYFDSLGLPASRMVDGYDVVDHDRYVTATDTVRADAEAWRTRYQLPPHFLLNIGRFVPKKNLPLLIEAFARIRKEPESSGWDLVLVGDGDERPRLEATCATQGVQWIDRSRWQVKMTDEGNTNATVGASPEDSSDPRPAVYWYGFRQMEENIRFYALAEAFVLPSLFEEWGLVVNEAMAAGLPVLVSRTAGCAEDLIMEGETGWTFDPGKVDSLVEALRKVCLSRTAEERTAMGHAGRVHVSKWTPRYFGEQAIRAAEISKSCSEYR